MENQEQADADIDHILDSFKKDESKWFCDAHDEFKQDLWGDGAFTCESCFVEAQMKAEEFLGVAEEDRE